MLDVNKALSFPGPSRGKGWIWLAWAVSVPGSLLIFLYTLFQPLFHFSETLRAWAEESPENVLALDRELEALLNGLVRPVILYNGTAGGLVPSRSFFLPAFFQPLSPFPELSPGKTVLPSQGVSRKFFHAFLSRPAPSSSGVE